MYIPGIFYFFVLCVYDLEFVNARYVCTLPMLILSFFIFRQVQAGAGGKKLKVARVTVIRQAAVLDGLPPGSERRGLRSEFVLG